MQPSRVYIIGGLLVAISVTFPLFLLARVRVSHTDPVRTRRADAIGLALLSRGDGGLHDLGRRSLTREHAGT
jgi:hypothetical protein